MLDKKKENKGNELTNEFDQVVVGNSLTKDAWKRLRKNKMAVLGLVVVVIYALLATFASLLPMYDYDQIILDHQNLQPSWNTSSGDLMMVDKKETLFFTAWKEGRLVLTPEQDAQIREWIEESKTNKVWDMVYQQGIAKIDSGEFSWNSSEQKAIEKLQTKIDTEVFVDVVSVKIDNKNITKLDTNLLIEKYAELIGMEDSSPILEQSTKEMRSLIENSLELTEDEKEVLGKDGIAKRVDSAIEAMGSSTYEKKLAQNIIGKIEAQILRIVTKDIKQEVKDTLAQEKDVQSIFPYKNVVDIDSSVKATVTASLKNSRHYLLGTDYSGRDLLARIIYGGQISIMIGLVGTLFSVFIGIVLGALAGYLGGKVDYIIMRIVDVMYGLPYMLIVIICMAIFGRSIMNLFIALGIVSWLTIARMVRGQIMSLKNSEYVEAARSMGAKTWRIIFRHMIPNSLSIIIVYSTLRIPAFIMQESFLSFLGLGVQAPFASWGSLISNGVSSMTIYPWRLIYPSIAMTLFLFAMNFFGDGLRDAFDPQSKNQL